MTDIDILSIVEHRQWLLLAGAVLMALVVFGRSVAARAGLTGIADKAVSVAGAYLQDLSIMIPAFGYQHWPWALLAALRGALMSGGLAELLADLIKARKPPSATTPPRETTPTPRATPLPRPTGSSGASSSLRLAVVVAAVAVLAGTGCEGSSRCLAERSTVAALGIAAGMAEGLIPDTPEASTAMGIATASIDAGSALVSACEQLRDDSHDWEGWLTVAVAAIKAVLGIIRAAGVDIPASVTEAVERLEELLRDDSAMADAASPDFAQVADYQPGEW